MKNLNRLIGFLLVFTLMLTLMPYQAGAKELLRLECETVVNPLYADVIDPQFPERPAAVRPQATGGLEYTDSVEDAAPILRQGLVNRQASISIPFKMTPEDDFKLVSRAIWTEALAHTGVPTEGDYIAKQWSGYKASATGYSQGGYLYYTITYDVVYMTTAQQETEMDAAVAELLSSLDLEGKSNYEQLSAIYLWMCENITYDYNNLYDNTYDLKYTGYAALMNRTSVCQGYAVLLYRLCLEQGIDCRIVTGLGNGGGHAWNIVKLGSEYYNLDATWDASYYEVFSKYNYFLRSNDTFGDHVRDAEFTTEEFNAAYPMGTEDYDPTAQPLQIPGDINGDGSTDNKDLTRLFRYLSAYEVEVTEETLDINADGDVNNKDLTRLFQYLSGWDVEIH